jgi:hypothetical protein
MVIEKAKRLVEHGRDVVTSQNLTGAARKWMTSRPMYFRMTCDLHGTVGACAFSVDNDPGLVVDEIEKEAALVPPLSISSD